MKREETLAIGALRLDCGITLPAVEQRVSIYGRPEPDGSNVVLVEHALTGSSRAAEWWPQIAGAAGLFDPARYCIVGVNALGSCYGSTLCERPSVADIVRAELRALDLLGIERIAIVIGGSLGGMRALQWALAAPQRVGSAIVVGAHDHQSAMGIALNALQRDAIALDPRGGLRLARKIAMLTYKSEELLARRHDRRPDRRGRPGFDVEGYLEHQADQFEARMTASSYVALTHAMDSFDVRAARATGADPKVIFVGISSDRLFLASDVRAAARRFAARGFDARYAELVSDHGHDAFLAEGRALRTLLEPLLERTDPVPGPGAAVCP